MNTQFLLPLPGAATTPVGTTLAAMTANTPHLTNEQHRHRHPQLSHRHQQHHHKLVQQTQPNLNLNHHHHHPNGLPAVVVIDDEMSDETVAPQVAPPSPPQSSHGVAAPQQTKPLETQQPHTNQSPRKRSHVASSSSDFGAAGGSVHLLSGGPLHNAISANDAPFSHHHKSAAGGAPNAAAVAGSNKDDDLLAFERDMNRSHGSLGGCSNDGLPDAPLSGDGLLMFTGPEVFDFDDCLDDKNKSVFEGVGGGVQGKQVQDLAREKGVDVLSAMFEEDNAATAANANANAQQQQQRQHNSQQLQHGQQSPHSQQHGSEASFDVYDLASAPALPVPAVPAMVPVRPSPPPHSSAPHLAYAAPQVALPPPPQPMTSMPLAPPPLVQAPPQHQGHQQHQGHHQGHHQHQPHQQHQRHHHRESVLSTYSASSVHSAASYDASAAAHAQAHAPPAASSFDAACAAASAAANAQLSQTQAAQARHRDSIRSVLSATQSFSAGVGDRGGHGGNNDLQHLDNMSPEYRAKAKIQLEIEAQAERVRRSFLEAENSSSSGKGRRGSKSKTSSAAAAAAAAAADMAAANSSMKRRRTSEGFEASVSSLENSPSAPRRSSFVSLPAGGGHGGGSGRSKRPSLVKKRTDGRPIFQSGLRNYFRSCSSESERSSPPSVVASASPTANFHKSTTDLHSAWTTAMGGTTSRLHDSARSCDLPPRHHPRHHPRPPKRGSIAENLSASGSVSNLLSNMHLNSETVTLEGRDGASIEVTKNDVVISGGNAGAGSTDTTNGEASVTDALVGNRRFAVLIDLHARSYADAGAGAGESEGGRIEVARSVVHTVTSSVPPGRFLKQLDDDAEADTEGSAEKKGLWGEMSYQEAVEYAQRSLGEKTTSEAAKACPHSPMSSDGSKKSVDSKSTVVSVVEPIVEEEKKSRRANMRRMSSGRALAA